MLLMVYVEHLFVICVTQNFYCMFNINACINFRGDMEEGNSKANGKLVNESTDLDKSSTSSTASDKAMNTVNHIIQVSQVI